MIRLTLAMARLHRGTATVARLATWGSVLEGFLGDDAVADGADALDLAFDQVAWLDLAHTCRRPGRDNVARLEGHRRAQPGDLLGNAIDHIAGAGVLP